MEFTRRSLFRSGAVIEGVAATGAIPSASGSASAMEAAPAAAAPPTAATAGTTLVKSATAGAGGYRKVVTAAGKAHLLREDLGAHRSAPSGSGTPVVAFAQLSDVHIVDAQSPMRLEFTDRIDDPSPIPADALQLGLSRAHEMLSGQISDAMVREINQIGVGLVTGRPLDLVIQTGDNSDNSQFNEVDWNIRILNGGQVRVDSGNLNQYEGVADDNNGYYDPAYWQPHGTPLFKADDVYRKRYGFPVAPGLLNASS